MQTLGRLGETQQPGNSMEYLQSAISHIRPGSEKPCRNKGFKGKPRDYKIILGKYPCKQDVSSTNSD
jgi:hypothetical protein